MTGIRMKVRTAARILVKGVQNDLINRVGESRGSGRS